MSSGRPMHPLAHHAEWKRIVLLVGVLALIVLLVGCITYRLLYRAALSEEKDRLFETARSEARLLEAMARHEVTVHGSDSEVLTHVVGAMSDAHGRYEGFGDTGEFTLALRDGDQIVFLIRHRHAQTDTPSPVPWESDLAEPMRRALSGESGMLVGLDYRGATVVAAYEPVGELGLGIVAKIDLSEVQAPFVRAALYSLGPALAAILVGAFGFTQITRPILRRIGETEHRYEELVETMSEGVAVQDESGTIVYANDRFCQILGRPRDEVVGALASTLLAPEGLAQYERHLVARGQEATQSCNAALLRPDGSTVNVLISSRRLFDGAGRFRGSFAVVSDITTLKEVEDRLRREKEQMQRYLAVAGVMFVVIDRGGRITLMNEKGAEILGYAVPGDLVGLDWFTTCVPEDDRAGVRAIFDRLMGGEIELSEYFENRVLTRSGETRIVAWHNTVLKDDAGSIVGTLSSGEDITARRRAEREKQAMEMHLRQSQKLESIGTLASGVAHELNNPLTGVINYAQLIQDRVSDETLKGYAAGIVEEGNRMARIVRELLSFARQDVDRHSLARMEDLVDQTLSLIGAVLRKEQIRVEVEIPPGLPKIRCRSQQIQQVLMNLLTNARDALNARYPEYDEDKVIRISAEVVEDGAWLRTTVEDHGVGIADEHLDRVFDPFFTTKPRDRGTGIGLAISYGIVRDHAGRMMVETEVGAYTRVVVDLPAEPEHSAEQPRRADGHDPDRRRREEHP